MKPNQVTTIVALLIIAVFAIPTYANSVSRGGKFVGLSDHFVRGDVHLKGLERACVRTFNSRTRVCTSEEIIKAPPLRRPIPDDGAWVYPTTVDATPDLINGGFDMMDFSLTSSTSLTNFSCRVWTTRKNDFGDPATGLIVRGRKIFDLGRCDQRRAVACCKAE